MYHVLAPRSTRLSTLLRPSVPIVFPCKDRQKGGVLKRKFLYAQVNEKSLPDAFPLRKAEGVGIAKIQGFVKAPNPL
jgi:hypothetical protein